jgi:hypothetical protein
MKNYILILTLLLSAAVSSAQAPATTNTAAPKDNTDESTFRLGLRASPSLGWIKSDKNKIVTGNGTSLGFNWGLIADIKFADNYFFSTGLDVMHAPLKMLYVDTLIDHKGKNTDVELSYRTQYIGLPLTLKLKTKEVSFMRYYGQFGIEPEFNIAKKIKVSKGEYAGLDWAAPKESTFINFDNNINFLRLGVVVGAGVEYSLGGKTALVGGITFNGGLTDISSQDNLKIANNIIALNLGVLF